jgi:hypothetical protein
MAMVKQSVQESNSKDWGLDHPELNRSHPANLHAYMRDGHDETVNTGKKLKNWSLELK